MRRVGAAPLAVLLCAAAGVPPHGAAAQGVAPLTLSQALARAEAASPRGALASVDSAAAERRLVAAGFLPDPALVATVTRDRPRWHLEADAPLDLPWIRSPRIRAARWAARAAAASAGSARALLLHDVTVAYEEAAAARSSAAVSAQALADALRLLDVARERRAAGDAAELDVLLGELEAGRARGQALTDSLAALDATLTLQALLVLPTTHVVVEPITPLATPVAAALEAPTPGAPPLGIAAARAETEAATARLVGARGARFPEPGLIVGVEGGAGPGEPSLLPLVGVTLTLPLFSRGRGETDAARFDLEASRLRLEQAIRFAAAEEERASRGLAAARERIAVHDALLNDAERVSALTLVGYREGALSLAQVLEARRLALDARTALVEQLLLARLAEARLRLAEVAGVAP